MYKVMLIDFEKLSQVIENFCPDGLVFDESSTSYAKCSFPFSIDCTGNGYDHYFSSFIYFFKI